MVTVQMRDDATRVIYVWSWLEGKRFYAQHDPPGRAWSPEVAERVGNTVVVWCRKRSLLARAVEKVVEFIGLKA